MPAVAASAAGVEHADGTEVGLLLQSFHSVTDRITELQRQLDAQQGRYNRNMDIAVRIGRETATLYDLDELLNRAIDLICNEFDFYHAQVFLIDDIGENAVLTYSHGEVGQRLLESKHKLAVGSESVIGRVTQAGTSVIVNDTTVTDVRAPHTVNPLLPDTRAEMALPLQIGERIIGALDVQSKRPNSFQSDEIRTLQILADQIAVAIQNVRLLVQSEERVSQIDALNRQLTRTAWEETSRRSALEPIYRYDLLTLRHDEGDVQAERQPADCHSRRGRRLVRRRRPRRRVLHRRRPRDYARRRRPRGGRHRERPLVRGKRRGAHRQPALAARG